MGDQTSNAYLELIRAVHDEWNELERAGDESVQVSATALAAIKEAVRVEARHGCQVHMPDTALGTYSVSELALRNLLRNAADTVPGVCALNSEIVADDKEGVLRERETPQRLACRISVQYDRVDFINVAEQVRSAIAAACAEHFGLRDVAIDVHIEDLHEC
ncbi:hypothetical protein [Corynebacterium sp.]|uniref:hypothetical protein n=1 Tax=Corynebacterium sp. TaxID=1720 RepID=UPI0026DD2147|nr:hypothetical protein [Corynebacterium sp.]MDO5077300.1 hypothetical protein [Corynebacterium sp.]